MVMEAAKFVRTRRFLIVKKSLINVCFVGNVQISLIQLSKNI